MVNGQVVGPGESCRLGSDKSAYRKENRGGEGEGRFSSRYVPIPKFYMRPKEEGGKY